VEWPKSKNDDATWREKISNYAAKERIAREMAARLRDGDVVGVGSGSTSLLTLHALVEVAHQKGLRFRAITTSLELEIACAELGVATLSLLEARPEWSFDGADEIDAERNMIKGRGGAMVREKLIMSASPERYVLADESKLVTRLGQSVPIPVEVIPEALELVQSRLHENFAILSSDLRLAVAKDGPIITEYGNLILDVRFSEVRPELDTALNSLPGIVGTGLFIGFAPTLLSA
jgi:ribose 5-phosphate isomerase A